MNTGHKLRTAIALGASAVLALTACAPGGDSSSAAAPAAPGDPAAIPVKMTGFAGSFASLSVYVANRKGFFAAHGIKPDFVTVTSGSAAAQALLSGSADMANVAIFETLTAAAKGEELKYIVGAATGSFGELVVRKDLALPHEADGFPGVIQDLKGKKIAVSSKGSATYYGLAYTLKQAGLDPDKDVQIIVGGALPSQVTAMKAGQIDAFVAQEPVTTQVEDSGDARAVYYQYQGKRPALFDDLITNGILTTDKYIAANPAAVTGVHDAVAEADDFIAKASPAQAGDLAKLVAPDFTGIKAEVLTTAIQHYQHLYAAVIPTAGVDAANKLLLDNGVLKSAIPADQVLAPSAMK